MSSTSIRLVPLSFIFTLTLVPFVIAGPRVPIKINVDSSNPYASHNPYGGQQQQQQPSSHHSYQDRTPPAPQRPTLNRQPMPFVAPPMWVDPANQQAAATATTTTDSSTDSSSTDSANRPTFEQHDPLLSSIHSLPDAHLDEETLNAWVMISGNCIQSNAQHYIYTFCPYHNITQRSTQSTLHVVLGVWSHWEADSNGLIMSFTDGTQCASGKRRSTRVHLQCTTSDAALLNIVETRTCEYDMTFQTPLACTEQFGTQSMHSQQQETQHASDQQTIQQMQLCINALTALQDSSDDYLTICAPFIQAASPSDDTHQTQQGSS